MLIDGRLFKILKLEDLSSPVSFSNWIQTNLKSQSRFSRKELLKSGKLLRFIEFLEDDIKNQSLDNNPEWFTAIKQIKDSIKSQMEFFHLYHHLMYHPL